MHRHDALLGKPVVHHGEDTLLHFSSVESTADNSQRVLHVETDEDFTVKSIFLPVLIGDIAAIDNSKVRLEVLNLLGSLRSHEHICDEMMLPSNLGDKADLLSGGRVGTRVTIKHIDFLGIGTEVISNLLVELFEHILPHGSVHRSPPDVVAGRLGFHDPLIFRRSTSKLAGIHSHSTVARNSKSGFNFVGINIVVRQIAENLGGSNGRDAVHSKIKASSGAGGSKSSGKDGKASAHVRKGSKHLYI
mmetsp:Transcript_44408/g.96991  ORF Transcript_44408/g.96991 Transcript_44408/m.96991 type:complete len:247 (-) Transcript_44408:13-753(-)